MVAADLRKAGLGSCRLILGIDFTNSNGWTGKLSFNNQSLHAIGDIPNPYEKTISIIGEILASFDDDNLIHCFGFGDADTCDEGVFSFRGDHTPCHGFKEVLFCYENIAPNLRLKGPTSYAPVIDAAVDIVEKSGGRYHVLVIISDGKVANTSNGDLSPQEKHTIKSIVTASSHPLSIIVVGVGDGPWEDMQRLVDMIPAHAIGIFQFVNFTAIMSENKTPEENKRAFALAALMKIPIQYKAAFERDLLGCQTMSRQSSSIDEKSEYSFIRANYRTLERAMATLGEVGVESLDLVFGLDFTFSNEWNGKVSFNNQSLHAIGDVLNPYEKTISIIEQYLAPLIDCSITCFGFGDAATEDRKVFNIRNDNTPCLGFAEVLTCYKNIVQRLKLSGPTSYAPVIDAAINIVEISGGKYHVLVIIADGQITRNGVLSRQEDETLKSIVNASSHPLSIIVVGVGDGPWEDMQRFVDMIPARAFDNFQFINFTAIMSENKTLEENERAFALAVLMKIPTQYKAAFELGLLRRKSRRILPHPPPVPYTGRKMQREPRYLQFPSVDDQAQDCPICYCGPINVALNCGHRMCRDCSLEVPNCPLCRCMITRRLQLFN